ncbi:MAG TPA: nucleotide exchange factor GrpE [Epsilonproteobacteria bacterium]|nr:nucleotide exchange factor GrpE [Campylobacterota bacterium]HHH37127.1 nucleotide exchange factor GrpE [Campylobacterota bacterium]
MSEKQDEMLSDEATEEQKMETGSAEENAEAGDTSLEAMEQELAEWKDKYLRAHADFENTKKRLERDKSSAVSYANESFAMDILAVIDSFEQALTSIEGADEANASEVLEKMKEGVYLTYEQLKKVLEKNYIKEINCEGAFDPNLHQAIMQIESDEHESGQIVQTLQKGYTIKDRVLRPSMVSTSK